MRLTNLRDQEVHQNEECNEDVAHPEQMNHLLHAKCTL